MRKKLGEKEGERKKFKAIFNRLGKKVNFKGYSEDTILLTDVTDLESNKVLTDHIWFAYTKGFEAIKLTKGTCIEFEARVVTYRKGYVNSKYKINKQTEDFKLSHPTKIKCPSPSTSLTLGPSPKERND